VSKHLSVLRQAGLVESRKEARWMFYRVAREPSPSAQAALDWVVVSLARDPLAMDDARKLKAILKQDPEEICKRQQSKRDACCSCAPATPAAARWPKASPAS
jgi:DNA-binding transcriptional ArsR family regulator